MSGLAGLSKFSEYIEYITVDESNPDSIFNDASNRGYQSVKLKNRIPAPEIANMVNFIGDVFDGRRPMRLLTEALTTADFPLIFGDTLDRMMVNEYTRWPQTWRTFLYTSVVNDFRTAKRFSMYGGRAGLTQIPEGGNYPSTNRGDASYSVSVAKYGKRYELTFEDMVNDDLGALRDLPQVLAEDAAESLNYFASSLYVANSTLYAVNHAAMGGSAAADNDNLATAPLSITALEAAYTTMAKYRDADGRPVMNRPVYLVVGPGLELTALKALSSAAVAYYGDSSTASGLDGVPLTTSNVISMKGLQVVIDPYIPVIDATNGATSWYLFAPPSSRRIAVEVAFLRGHEQPKLFRRLPSSMAMGGGDLVDGASYDNDTISWKVRHVYGGQHANALDGWMYTYHSDGTG